MRDCLEPMTSESDVDLLVAVGGVVGAAHGTVNAFVYKMPGLMKIRYIGKTTLGTAAVFGLISGVGSLINKSY